MMPTRGRDNQATKLLELAEFRYNRELRLLGIQRQDVLNKQRELDVLHQKLEQLNQELSDSRLSLQQSVDLTAHELQLKLCQEVESLQAMRQCESEVVVQEQAIEAAKTQLQVLQSRLHEMKLRGDALNEKLGARIATAARFQNSRAAEVAEDDFAQRGYLT